MPSTIAETGTVAAEDGSATATFPAKVVAVGVVGTIAGEVAFNDNDDDDVVVVGA